MTNFDYKIFIPISYPKEHITIPSGLYDVLWDNATYHSIPTICRIKYKDRICNVHVQGHDMWEDYSPLASQAYAMLDTFDPQMIQKTYTKEEMLRDLEALRPYYITVDGYVNGDEEYDWKGFENIKEAHRAALMAEWSYKFVTKEQMEQSVLRAWRKIATD